ncbi:FIP1[III]-like protein isoform X2 [Senna tora]|uniref:FIP1[III]-like protein isoform X2 n=1 Tax=Senna tora TaxID=362788 RepID=A0A834X525_9FABA|nr:FIP1[III]-like protein isoform X2 [Senna tora]
MPGVDRKEHQSQVEQRSEDTAEASEGEMKAEEGVDFGSCTADLCLIESELSFGDQDLSLTSYSDSESENSVHANNEKKNSPLRRQLVKSATDLQESVPSYHNTSRNNSFYRKPVNVDYYSRNRGPVRQEQRPQRCRHEPGSKMHKYNENHNEVFSNPMSGARELALCDPEFFNHGRQKERLRDFDSHKKRSVSYYRETEQSCHYDGEKLVDDMVHTVYTKYSYREGRDSFRENTIRNVRKNWDEREYNFEHRTVMEDNEDSEQDWYHADRGYFTDELSPPSYRVPRELMSRHCSFPAKERDIQRRRMHEKPHFRDRNSDNDQWFNECRPDLIDKSYRMSTSIEREREVLDNKHEQQFMHFDRELERSSRRGRHCYKPQLDSDSLWSGRMEDECQEYTHHQTSNLQYCRLSYPYSEKNNAYDIRENGNLRGYGRYKHARDGRGSNWYYNNIDATEDKDFIIHPAEEFELGRRRYSSPSEVLHWTEGDETLWHKGTHARYESLHDEIQLDDIQLQQHQLNMPRRRDSDNYIKRSSRIICRDKRGQAKLKCRNSIDLVKGEGKSNGRSSRSRSLMCNGRLVNLDQGITENRTASMGFNKSHMKKATKSESDRDCRKWLQSIPDKGQKGLDAEESQIVTEEPYLAASMSRGDVSEGAALTGDNVKKRMLCNENNSDQENNIGGYDSKKILETLARMEKRRERFKEPMTMKKEAEKSLKLNDDLIVDTDETKQHRPARKRRWGGS